LRIVVDVRTDTELTPDLDLETLAAELRIVLGRLVRRLRAEYRFPLTQASVLGRLDREGAQCIGELATAERVRPQSMSQTLAELEADGLIERTPDTTDGRRTRIALTAEGRAALEADRAARDGWLGQAITQLTDGEQEILHEAVLLMNRLSSAD
jgi:DNA-binding MarR family transcriptional regulator